MFVLLNPKAKALPPDDDSFQLIEDFRLPRSCKTVVLNLQNTTKSTLLNCCEHLIVYDDLLTEYNNLKVTDEIAVFLNDSDNDRNNGTDDINETIWFNSTVFVRGFKDELVRGKSIWN